MKMIMVCKWTKQRIDIEHGSWWTKTWFFKLCGKGNVPVPSVGISILLTVSTLYYTVSSWTADPPSRNTHLIKQI